MKAQSEITYGIALILILFIAILAFNQFILKDQLQFGKSSEKVTSPTEASQKTQEIGKDLQDVSSTIEDIEKRLG